MEIKAEENNFHFSSFHNHLLILQICSTAVVWKKHLSKLRVKREMRTTFSFHSVVLRWGRGSGRGWGGLPSFLSASSCLLQPSPLWSPRLHRCQATGAGGWARQGAAQETGNHEREEAIGIRGSSGHDVSELPQSLWENDRVRIGSSGGLPWQA